LSLDHPIPTGETAQARSMDLPDTLLRGAIDLHVHAGPHLRSSPRRADPLQVAWEARAAGMRALLYLDVFKESAGTAWLVSRMVEGIEVYGGLILASNHGGLNPRAVKTALRYGSGARFVSLGAHSTRYLVEREGRLVDGHVTPYAESSPPFAASELPRSIDIPLSGPVPDALLEVLDLVAAAPQAFLNTGHVSPEEALRVVELARIAGVSRVLVAHFARRRMTLGQQREAVGMGAILEAAYADHVYPSGFPRAHYYDEPEHRSHGIANDWPLRPHGLAGLVEDIRAIGPAHFVLVSDYGIRGGPTPVEGMRAFITALLDQEVPISDVVRMTAHNPAQLLGLEAL
jgi:hypothetical protein